MNILFLSELFYPHGSGAELATYLYARLLCRTEHRVIVVTNLFEGELRFSEATGFPIYRLQLFENEKEAKYSMFKRMDVNMSRFLAKLVKWADIVYVPRFWFPAILIAKAHGKPVITHLHDYIPICPLSTAFDSNKKRTCETTYCSPRCIYEDERRSRRVISSAQSAILNLALKPFLKRVVALSDAVVCVSNAQKEILTKRMPSLRKKVKVIYNPEPKLDPLSVEGDDFGYFGGPSYRKGFFVLFTSMLFLNRDAPHKAIIHGTKFSQVSGGYARSLSRTGFVTYQKLDTNQYSELYRRIKTVTVPSIWDEPLPYVVSEAIARGRLIVASRIGGIPEQTRGYKGVFLVEPADHQKLAHAMETAGEISREAMADISAYNIDLLKHKHSRRNALREFISLCDAVI